MPQYVFGAGTVWAKPLTDANGTAIANPTPVKLGALNNISLDVSWDTKMLHGEKQFPLAVGRGKGKVSGKAAMAQLNGALLNSVVFGQTINTGLIADHNDTVGAVVPSTPYIITVTPPSTGTYSKDLGVISASGLPVVRVASAPSTGQYAVNESTGAYTFAAADVGIRMFISYAYTATVVGAVKSTVVNLPMGYAPSFGLDLSTPFQGKQLTIQLPNCIGSKFAMSTKQDDFMIPDFDFEGFADAAGNVMTYSLSE